MRTAICFTGTCRSLDHTYQNICEFLIDPIDNCDIFAFVPKTPHINNALQLLNNTNLKKIVFEKEGAIDETGLSFVPGWPPKTTTTQIYLKMVQSRKKINDMLTSYEVYNNFRYDRVIFSRLDVKYYTNVSQELENHKLDNLLITDFHNTIGGVIYGYNDRFAVGDRKVMSSYLNLYDSVGKYSSLGGKFQAETFLKWHLKNNGIFPRKIPIRFGRVRSSGEEIDTRLKESNLENRDT